MILQTVSKLSALFLVLTVINSASAKFGDATYYLPAGGTTACGTQHSNSDMIAATAFSYWVTPNPNNDPMCKRFARVTDPQSGRSIVVQIKDKCSGCKRDDIDLSSGAFQQLRPLSVGRFKVNWDFTN